MASALQSSVVLFLIGLAVSASTTDRNGLIRAILPALIILLWCQMGLEFFSHSTWSSLFKVTFGAFAVVLAFPFFVVYCVLKITSALFSLFLSLPSGGQFVMALLVIAVTTLLILSRKTSQGDSSVQDATKAVCLTACIALAIPLLLYAGYPYARQLRPNPLSLDEYCNTCGPEARKITDNINLQIECSKFLGRRVEWSGMYESKKIAFIENTALTIISKFPYWLQSLLKCVFGKMENG